MALANLAPPAQSNTFAGSGFSKYAIDPATGLPFANPGATGQMFDVGDQFVKHNPAGGFYGVPTGLTPFQGTEGGGTLSPDQLKLLAESGILATGVAGIGAEGVAGGGIGGSSTGVETDIGGGGTGGVAGTGALQGGGSSGVIAGEGAVEGAVDASGVGNATSGTAMSRILDGTATTADWLSVGGNLAGTGIGIAGSRNAANAYGGLADKYMAFGAPSRARYEASMTPGFDPTTIPGYSGAVDTASKGILARLSATGGNPWGNPGGLIEANKQIISGTALPAIQDYQRLNAGTGGYAGFNAAAPGAASAGIGAQGGVYNAVGSGLAGLLNPQPSLYDTLARLGVQGLS